MTNSLENKINKLVGDIETYRQSYYVVNPPAKIKKGIIDKLSTIEINFEEVSSLKALKRLKEAPPMEFTVVFVEKTFEIIKKKKSGDVFRDLGGNNMSVIYFLRGEITGELYNDWFSYCSENHIEKFNFDDNKIRRLIPNILYRILKKILISIFFILHILALFFLAIYLPFKTAFSGIIPDLAPSIFKGEELNFLQIILIFLFIIIIIINIICFIKKVPYDYYYKKFYKKFRKDVKK